MGDLDSAIKKIKDIDNRKKTVEIDVDTVEQIDFMLNWITTTITLWQLNDKWPTNLIQDTVDELIKILSPYWHDPLN